MVSSTDATIRPFEQCTVEKPGRRHFCQIHHCEESLVDAIARFAKAGIEARDAVVLLAPDERHENVFARLHEIDVDPDAALNRGDLVLGRPEDFQKECVRDGVLDEQRFKDSFRATLDLGGPQARVRLYGEISNAFWHAGDIETAIRLDYLAEEVMRDRRVAVFCGYLLDGLNVASYQPAVEHLCRVHSCIPETAEDARLRAAVDEASQEVLGVPLSVALNRSRPRDDDWADRLPLARRTVLWLQRNMPAAMIQVLDRARLLYR